MTAGLVAVHLLGFPLRIFDRARQHQEALLREFRLIALAEPVDQAHVPRRLLELVDELDQRYGQFASGQAEQAEDALARGEDSIDLVYHVPPAARDASLELGVMLDEADEFCRRGALLTLETPPDCREFRAWFLDEFVRQIDGEAPRPWSARRDASTGRARPRS